jgi:late competence protein required for DNA uptake (superfamily II DNA/RNA helicase)
MLPNEYTLQCKKCGAYNIEIGIIKEGNIYCKECWLKEIGKRDITKWD